MAGTAEKNIAKNILIAASHAGHRLFVNTRGLAYRKDGTPVRYGVGPNGAADLIGWTRDGRFAAIEVKRPRGSHIQAEQRAFIAAVIQAGGRAGICKTVEQALAVLDGHALG